MTQYKIAVANACARSQKVHTAFLDCVSDSRGEPLSKAVRRAQYEEIQRACAKKRERIIYKSKPKRERQQEILESRYKRSGVIDVEPQAGVSAWTAAALGAGVGVGCCVAAYPILRRLVSSVEKVADSVSSAADEVSALANHANEAVWSFKRIFQQAIDACKSVVGALWQLVFGTFVCAMKAALGFSREVARLFDAALTALVPDMAPVLVFEHTDLVEQQSCSGMVPGLVALVCSLFLPAGQKQSWFYSEILRRIGNYDRVASGFEAIFSFAGIVVEDAVNCVLRFLGREEVRFVSEVQRRVASWCTEVDKTLAQFDLEKTDLGLLNRGRALLGQGHAMKAITSASHLKTAIDKQLDRLNHKIASHRGMLDADSCFRQQPIFVLFGGESGIGKTNIIKLFTSVVLQEAGICGPDECAQHMWQKGESEYWNGYCGQAAMICDDIFQKKAVAGSPDSEGFCLIRAISNWAFPLNYADVDSKGKNYFDSYIIVGTTNCVDVKSALGAALTKPEAVTRRIDHGYWVELDPKYCTDRNTLDYSAVTKEYQDNLAALRKRLADGEVLSKSEVLNAYPWHAWRLRRHTYDGNISTGATSGLSMLDLAKAVASELRARRESHVQNVADIDDWLHMLSKAELQSGLSVDDVEPLLGDVRGCVNRYHTSASVADSIEFGPLMCELDDVCVHGGRLGGKQHDPPDERVSWRQLFSSGVKDRNEFMLLLNAKIHSMLSGVPPYVKTAIFGTLNIASAAASVYLGHKLLAGVIKLVQWAIQAVKSTMVGLYRLMFGTPDSDEDSPAEIQSVHQAKAYPQKKSYVRSVQAMLQMGNPPSDVMADIIYANTFKLLSYSPEGWVPIGQIIMISGTVGMMPDHFRDIPPAKMRLVSCKNPEDVVDMTHEQFMAWPYVAVPQCDIAFVNIKQQVARAYRDITKYFITEKDFKMLQRVSNTEARLDVARLDCSNDEPRLARWVLRNSYLRFDHELNTVAGKLDYVWAYDMTTIKGDCGAPLTIAEPRYYGGRALLGMHIAGKVSSDERALGSVREGYSCIVTQEAIKSTLTRFKHFIRDDFYDDLAERGIVLDANCDSVIAQSGLSGGSIGPIGIVAKDQALSQSTQTKIKPTGFDGFGPCPLRPAHLSPVYKNGALVKPMLQAMANYKSPKRVSQVQSHKAIMGAAMQLHFRKTANCTRMILSKEEAVTGIPSIKLKAINRSTSCGYPWRLDCAEGKKDFFGFEDDYDFSNAQCQALFKRVDEIVAAAKNGVRLSHIFTDFLKDETRPHAKVDAVATRAISGAPLDYTIAVRQYFGAFLASMFTVHTVTGMAPGINPYSEWHVLARNLTRVGDKVFGGDFKAFDASEQPEIHAVILDYINSWYDAHGADPIGRTVRTVLFEDLVHSRHLTGTGSKLDTLVQWNKSLPSGHPLTTPVNSMYSLFTLVACYYKLTGKLEDLWDNVFICTFGDDNVVSVSDDVCDQFNQVTVAQAMNDLFGLTYTSDKKDAELVPWEPIQQVTFLKRSFQRAQDAPGGWCAPLALDSTLYRTYFYKNARAFTDEFSRNMKECLLELALHQKEVWDAPTCEGVSRFEAAQDFCRRGGIPFDVYSYEQARELCFSRIDVWY